VISDPHFDGRTEAEVVTLVEHALEHLHARYSDEPTLLERFGAAAADDVRLALENAREGFDRFLDHFRDAAGDG
jgi:hypothetical protein